MDLVVYLRGSNIHEYHQESVRRDLIEMLLDAQEHHENAQDVFGLDYKAFANEIIDNLPQKSRKMGFLENLSIILLALKILIPLLIAQKIILSLKNHDSIQSMEFLFGDVLSIGFIILSSILIYRFITTKAFETNNKGQLFLQWLIITLMLTCAIMFPLLFDQKLFNFSLIIIAMIYALIWGLSIMVERRYNEILSNDLKSKVSH